MEQFESNYDALLASTRAALPNVQLVLCEPFGLPTGWRRSKWDALQPRIAAAQAATARLAKKHKAVFVPLQRAFDDACKRAPAELWIWDGIHPTYRGQQVIADEWVRVAGRKLM